MTWDWTVVEDSLVDEFQFHQILNLDFIDDAVILGISKSLDFLLDGCRISWENVWALEFIQYFMLL